eukprot:gene4155-biopygen9139
MPRPGFRYPRTLLPRVPYVDVLPFAQPPPPGAAQSRSSLKQHSLKTKGNGARRRPAARQRSHIPYPTASAPPPAPAAAAAGPGMAPRDIAAALFPPVAALGWEAADWAAGATARVPPLLCKVGKASRSAGGGLGRLWRPCRPCAVGRGGRGGRRPPLTGRRVSRRATGFPNHWPMGTAGWLPFGRRFRPGARAAELRTDPIRASGLASHAARCVACRRGEGSGARRRGRGILLICFQKHLPHQVCPGAHGGPTHPPALLDQRCELYRAGDKLRQFCQA